MNEHVRVTDYVHGPFAIVVTDPARPDDADYPMIVAPEGGFATKEAAIDYLDKLVAKRKVPYLGLHYVITQVTSPSGFMRYCSWED